MSTVAQRNFAAGEVAPAIYGKVDQVKFQTGVRTARNCYVMRHGGLTSRPGTEFICEVKDSTAAVRLLPFAPNSTQTFVLEYGNLYARRILNSSLYTSGGSNGQVLLYVASTITITGISAASQAVVTAVGHGYANGTEIYMYAIAGMVQLNGRNVVVSDQTANTFKIKDLGGNYIDSSSFTAYSSGGKTKAVFTDTTVYTTADLSEIRSSVSQNVLVTTHPSYIPKVTTYTYITSDLPGIFAFSSVTFGSGVATPSTFTNTSGTIAGTLSITWYLTAVNDSTGEESVATTWPLSPTAAPAAGAEYTFTFTPISGCTYYRLYRRVSTATTANQSVFGYLTTIVANGSPTTLGDAGQYTVDPSKRPPSQLSVLATSSNYPSCVGTFQQRYAFGCSNNNTERVWISRTGASTAFWVSSGLSLQRSFPLQDDDAFLFDIIGREFNGVKHLLEMKLPVIFTQSAEYVLEGDTSGAITPTAINKRTISYNGSSSVAPVIIGESAIYIQERGQIVRDLSVEFQADGYQGNDLTTFSPHLVENYTIVDMAYQKTPHSIVWLVRSDGVLLSLTYVKEQRILGWARHDFDGGTVENVCCIPEGIEYAVYVVVKRTINGRTTRYIERLATRVVGDITDYVGMDSAITRDGTNTTATTMTISGGTNWTYDEHLTVTASSIVGVNVGLDAGKAGASTGLGFSSSDVGNAIDFYDSDGVFVVRILIDEYTSTTVVKGRASETVPAAYRSTAISTWGHAKTVVTGLWHLIGEDVSVLGDGAVVASPNNADYDTLTVSATGTLTLPQPYVKVHVGLPFIADIETLNVDTDQGETLADKQSIVTKLTLQLEKTRGGFIGPQPPSDDEDDPLEKLSELRTRNEEGYNELTELFTGELTQTMQGNWNKKGRVFIRQVDPLPITVNSIMPAGLFPFSKKGGG